MTAAVLEVEGAPEADPYLSHIAAYVHELPADAVHTAATARAAVVRVTVSTPSAALDRDGQRRLVQAATAAVATASDNVSDAWHAIGPQLALRSTAPDGTCTSTAIYFEEQPSLPLLEMYTMGVTFTTGRAHVRPAIPHVLAFASTGALHPEHVTTRTVAWNDAPDALTAGSWTKLVFQRGQ